MRGKLHTAQFLFYSATLQHPQVDSHFSSLNRPIPSARPGTTTALFVVQKLIRHVFVNAKRRPTAQSQRESTTARAETSRSPREAEGLSHPRLPPQLLALPLRPKIWLFTHKEALKSAGFHLKGRIALQSVLDSSANPRKNRPNSKSC